MSKINRDQLTAELAVLDGIIGSLPPNDALGRLTLTSRRQEIESRLEQLSASSEKLAKIALYFAGKPVIGSTGIEAGFSTAVLSSFQDLVTKIWSEIGNGELQASGRIPDSSHSQLHITSLVQGSFGFLLEELDETEPLFETPLFQATDKAADYIKTFASENERDFLETIEEINPRIFISVKEFFGSIHRAKATVRLVEENYDEQFDETAIQRAWSRIAESDVDEVKISVEGRLLGVIPVKRRFEFEPDNTATILEGKVGEQFSHSYLERISTEQFAGRRWKAVMQHRIVTKSAGRRSETYTLLELNELVPNAS